jgi:hypothetical protein
VDGEVKGVGMKDIQKKKSSGRRGKKECEWTTSKYIIKYKEGKKKRKKEKGVGVNNIQKKFKYKEWEGSGNEGQSTTVLLPCTNYLPVITVQ